ncbi:beta-taxilin isoform X1 [Tripterygium wilfordii]|uniref:Beta-taxilin isoform X1 n=1 Tax=Tripterygium wilfordii TaxID=458696 RepID=A0A7J7D831_TRIWF|nr:beta-taxilin isoform X1 [Tripterygium wilfordii]
MENPDANQLPEVDSLPDGFVDSSTEHLAPQTPTFEQEKPVNSHKDDVSEPQHSNEASLEVIVDESQKSHRRAEKEKLRTFPVPLSDSNNFEANLQSAEVTDESCVEQTEGTTVMPNAAVVSKASVGISECSEEMASNIRSNYVDAVLYTNFTSIYSRPVIAVITWLDGPSADELFLLFSL